MLRLVACALLFLAAPALPAWGAAEKACDKSDFAVALDVGHGKKRYGALSARGVKEFDFNLRMARLIAKELQHRGVCRVFLINEAGKNVSLSSRPALAAKKGADVFLSVHHDSVQPHYLKTWEYNGKKRRYCDKFRGHSLFVSTQNPNFRESLRLARLVGEELRDQGLAPTLHHAEKIKGENRELLDKENGVHRYDALTVLRRARVPAALLECGVIVNRDEELALSDPVHMMRIAEAVGDALVRFCEEQE